MQKISIKGILINSLHQKFSKGLSRSSNKKAPVRVHFFGWNEWGDALEKHNCVMFLAKAGNALARSGSDRSEPPPPPYKTRNTVPYFKPVKGGAVFCAS